VTTDVTPAVQAQLERSAEPRHVRFKLRVKLARVLGLLGQESGACSVLIVVAAVSALGRRAAGFG
jgi:hypothetical protein